MNGFVDSKPFKGCFVDWKIITNYLDEKIIIGEFDGHPEFHDKRGHSSPIVYIEEHELYMDVETLNSRYKLEYAFKETDGNS